MINEFASLTYACSPGDIVPSGPGYNSIANQVCAVVGSTPGGATIAGMDYLQAQYGFEASHMWRNIGINAGLFVAFALCTSVGMELLKVPSGRLNTILYKPTRDRSQNFSSINPDQEKGVVGYDVPLTVANSASSKNTQREELRNNPRTFEWLGIHLDIHTEDGVRTLLDDLSGNVRRDQMKALMGVSGAGKTVSPFLKSSILAHCSLDSVECTGGPQYGWKILWRAESERTSLTKILQPIYGIRSATGYSLADSDDS